MLFLLTAWVGMVAVSSHAAVTELIVTNARTGLAIDGFDPVAYFIDQKAEVGEAEFEARYRGAVWRFRNPGNLAAFQESPADYEPQFGGYDPMAIARGVPTAGNPQIWLVADGRLYLFYRAETQRAFGQDLARASQQAAAKWPAVQKLLSQ